MVFEAINLSLKRAISNLASTMESLANGNTSWLVASCAQHVAAVASISI